MRDEPSNILPKEAIDGAKPGKQDDAKGLGPTAEIRLAPTDEVRSEQTNEVSSEPTNEDNSEVVYDDADYIPDFVQELIDDPPILPSESKDAFQCLFESFELCYTQRPKTDLEYSWVFDATLGAWEGMRYDRIKASIIGLERRVAVEALHREVSAETVVDKGFSAMRKAARENARLFFTDPNYQKNFMETLKRTGFGAGAIDAMATNRALPSLSVLNRLQKAAEKRRDDALKKLDLAYAMRGPEDPMPRSLAALRADDIQQQRAAERKKEIEEERRHAQRKAVGGE